jgi:hypothetical protein
VRRSPIILGLVLGLVVGVAGVALLAATIEDEPRTLVVVADPAAPAPGPAPGSIERLAAAFDIHAPVQEDAGGWVARDGDRLLRVSRTTGLPWFLARFDGPCVMVPGTPGPEPLQTVPPSGPTDCPETAGPGETTPPARPADLPSESEARAIAVELFRRAGLEAEPTTVTDLVTSWRVEGASPEGGYTWAVTIGPKGAAVAANGSLTSI